MMKHYVIILSMYDLVHELKRQYELPLTVLRDVIELVAYCQIDSVRANGVESIYSPTPAYISPLDLIDEDLRITFSGLYPKSRYEQLKRVALEAWQELPPEETYWRQTHDVRDPRFKVRWHKTDLILEVS
jgi:hypothetical protein